ncbi:MAG: TnsA-like heteromeric transposase endonuclease subunit [Candidatus Nanopelagicales bacterium]
MTEIQPLGSPLEDGRATRLEWLSRVRQQSQIQALSHVRSDGNLLADAIPIRVPAFYRGQSSKPGYNWMASIGGHVSHESKAERLYLMELDWAGTATGVLPQPFRLHFPRTTRPFRHIPDFLTQYADSSREVVDVKGARQQGKPLNKLTFDLTRDACAELGFGFTVYAGPTTISESNLAFLAGYRGPGPAVLDEYLPALVDAVDGGEPTVAEANKRLMGAGVMPAMAPAVVWRAMWKRLVTCDLLSPLTSATRVRLSVSAVSEGAA